MSEYVLGRNVTVLVSTDLGSGESFYPLFCAKSMELDIIQEEIESTTITSGVDREFEIGIQSGVLTLVGVTKTTDTDKVSPFTLYNLKRLKKSYQVICQDQDLGTQTRSFEGLLRRLDFASNVVSFNQSTAEIRISGAIS